MPGSQTARGRRAARDDAARHVAFRCLDGVGTPKETFAAQWLACALPGQRFAAALTDRTSRITRGRGGWLGPTPWKTLTSYPLPACLAHSPLGQERRILPVP